MAKPGWDRVWAVGVVRARGGVGTPSKCKPGVGSGEAGVGWGVGTYWQPLNTL